jgi:XRE family transcriptional regulator, regulator of sulfur utilization
LDNINLLVSRNLKRIRDEKKLSLDKLAEMTGVSKSMLGQIERGDSSPTISTVWKIANGLKISFTALLNDPQPDTVIIRKDQIEPMVEADGRYRLYPLFPDEEGRRFEIYTIEIEKNGSLSAEAHPDGTQEYLTVFQGELTVTVAGQEYRAAQGDAIRFRADRPHSYRNAGEDLAVISLTIHYTG